MAHVLEVRAGAPLPVEDMLQKVPQWQIKDYSSGYIKTPVSGAVAVHFNGIEGNMAGYEGHVRDILDRAVLVFYEPIYYQLQEKFPDAMKTLKRGGFGENIVVDHPSLSPEEVCIGDVYQIGTVRLVVTAPRQPCPKVDVYHNVKGLTEYTKQHCKAGYFLRVLEEGSLDTGSEITLLKRPNPDLSVQKVSEGLWGPPELLDNSREFLTKLVQTEDLLEHLFRRTARERLQRLDEEEAAVAAVASETQKMDEASLAKQDEALAEFNFKCISIFMVIFTLYLMYHYKDHE